MRHDLALGLGQGSLLLLVLLAALLGPRTNEPAALIPLGSQRLAQAFAWASSQNIEPVTIDARTGRLIITAPDTTGVLSAVASGFLPINAGAAGCGDAGRRSAA